MSNKTYREIRAYGGEMIKVSPEDYDRLAGYPWFVRKNNGYVEAWDKRLKKPVRIHRLITNAQPGDIVDHRNHDRLDNRRENVRLCTKAQNSQNRKLSPLNSSGYKGVSRSGKKWRACIQVDCKQIRLGTFETKEEAAKAYDQAAKEYFGEFALLNFGGVYV